MAPIRMDEIFLESSSAIQIWHGEAVKDDKATSAISGEEACLDDMTALWN